MSDRGDNWNERWQYALALPNKTDMEIKYKCVQLQRSLGRSVFVSKLDERVLKRRVCMVQPVSISIRASWANKAKDKANKLLQELRP